MASSEASIRTGRPDVGPVETDRFCRVTVVAPRARLDVALPTDLTVAELVPMLCDLAGESGNAGQAASWCLAAVAGAELPPDGNLIALGVLDGDLLRLRRRTEAPPPPVFDDPVDAIAEVVPAADGSPGPWGEPGDDEPLAIRPWTMRCRRVGGLTAAGVAAMLAAGLLAAARGSGPEASPVAAVIAGLAVLAALGAATRAIRVDPAAAVLLAAGAVPLAAACGFTAVPGTPGAGHLLLAAALAAAAASAAGALLEAPEPVLIGALLAATVGALAAVAATFGAGPPAGLAAGAATVAIGMLPALPRISVQLAGLPPPVVPTTPEEMLAADARWELDAGEKIRYRSQLAHCYLGGLVVGASAIAGGGAALAALTGGFGGVVFASVVIAVLLLRSRSYATAVASGAPLVAGLAAGVALIAGLGSTGSGLVVLGCAVGLLVAASVGVTLVWAGADREPSPVARKAADVIEAVLVVATFPLALWVLDLYRAVQAL